MEHTGAVLKKDVRCHVHHQVVHQEVTDGQTGSHVRPHQDQRKAWVVKKADHGAHQSFSLPAEILAENREDQEVQPELENVYRLREIINSVMLRTNNYEKARRVVARILAAYKKLIPVVEQQLNVEVSEQNVANTY